MNTVVNPLSKTPTRIDLFFRKAFLDKLARLENAVLIISDALGEYVLGSEGVDGLSARIDVLDIGFYQQIALGGSIGAAESYMAQAWQADDLCRVVQILVRNRDLLDSMEGGLATLANQLLKIWHFANRNSQQGSRKNIAAHYDLGNDLFELFLDQHGMYSSATYYQPDLSLEEASTAKLERICQKLDLKPEDHLVEIGTGWGGFATYAASKYGCKITTTTISQQQFDAAQQRIAAAGVADRVTVLMKDYRELQGRYDKLVSIEMIEAVGHRFYDTYFRKCGELLKPDGMMLLQAITIADQRYAAARDAVDFIQRYIFPGSCIPSVTVMSESIARVTDMRVFHLEDIGPHYATTLKRWRENLFANIDGVRGLGYSDEFIRMWEFYLCYCEGGFDERVIGDVQMLMVKPGARPDPIVPPLAP